MSTDSADYERARLSELERDYQTLCTRIQAFEASAPQVDAMDAFLAQLREWKQYFGQYHAVASYLQGLGLLRFSDRLSVIQSHLDQAIQHWEARAVQERFAQMAATMREGQQRRAEIVHNTEKAVADVYQNMAEQSRKNHEDMRESWHRAFFGSSSSQPSAPNSGTASVPTPTPGPAGAQGWLPPDIPYSNFPSRHSAFCKVWECGKQCLQPAGHGGACYCENNHSGYW